jgi:oligopeptidase B
MSQMPLSPPPIAEQREVTTTLHGEVRTDQYAWLRDREDPATLPYLEAENSYTQQRCAHLAEFRKTLYDEMLGRIQQTDLSVPIEHGPYVYYNRTQEGLDYPIRCRRPLDGAQEQVLLDANVEAKDHKFYSVHSVRISPDHSMLAWAVDTTGYEQFVVHVRNLLTGETHERAIENVGGSLEWANDNRTLFYSRRNDAQRPYQAWRHTLDQDQDTLVFQEDDDRFFLYLERTRSDRFLVLGLKSKITSEVHLLDADRPLGDFEVVAPRIQGVEYDLTHHGDQLYLLTNQDALNFRLFAVPLACWDRQGWREVKPHRSDIHLLSVSAFAGHLVLSERQDGLPQLTVIDLENWIEHRVAFDEAGWSLSLSSNPEYHTTKLRFTYESLVTPASVFDYDMHGRDRVLRQQTPVLGGFDPKDWETQRTWATASDGVRIPITLVHRRGLVRDGSHPLWLAGYGSYGHCYDPYFSALRLSLLEREVVFGIAHIRGGGELGRHWYESGKMATKSTTFSDYIACAEHLVAEGWTTADRLVAQGGSAGGLLMGAIANMRPDLFHVVVAQVPFVDVVNTMLDETIPLTVIEWEEWGNPNLAPEFHWIRSYSPYDNVTAQEYPHMFVEAGLNDPRVQYWEPAKWVAKLRTQKTDDNVLLLKTLMGAGHGGSSGRYGRIAEVAFEYAFVLDRLGLAD